MPISKAEFDRGHDPGSDESRIEVILSKGQAYTAEELWVALKGPPPPSIAFLLPMSVDSWETRVLRPMLESGRIKSKEIDRTTYYSK